MFRMGIHGRMQHRPGPSPEKHIRSMFVSRYGSHNLSLDSSSATTLGETSTMTVDGDESMPANASSSQTDPDTLGQNDDDW